MAFFHFGEGFGLGIFYLISGYLLANIKSDTSFPKWYFKRLLRLYMPLLISRMVLVLV
ncbi:hypothetical protein DXC97_01575 [Lachnospiraceae bacterium TF09-5]|nr:hypothetical protein DXC97_01575 [Lachnospiraceae bacterium TF09-5]